MDGFGECIFEGEIEVASSLGSEVPTCDLQPTPPLIKLVGWLA